MKKLLIILLLMPCFCFGQNRFDSLAIFGFGQTGDSIPITLIRDFQGIKYKPEYRIFDWGIIHDYATDSIAIGSDYVYMNRLFFEVDTMYGIKFLDSVITRGIFLDTLDMYFAVMETQMGFGKVYATRDIHVQIVFDKNFYFGSTWGEPDAKHEAILNYLKKKRHELPK